MPAKKMSERQETIKRLLDADTPVAEIAEMLETSAQAIHTQMTKMRAAGHLPKGQRSGRRTRRATGHTPLQRIVDEHEGQTPRAAANGYGSVEEHVEVEHSTVESRLAEIEEQVKQLEDERQNAVVRRDRLAAAKTALTPA